MCAEIDDTLGFQMCRYWCRLKVADEVGVTSIFRWDVLGYASFIIGEKGTCRRL